MIMVSNSRPYHLLRRGKGVRPCVLKCQQTVYKTRLLQRRPVPSPVYYHSQDYRVVIANKKRGVAQPKKGKGSKKRGSMKKGASRVMKVVGGAIKSSVAESFRLTPCAAKYAIAIVDPWDRNAMGSCVPSNPARPSRKAHGYVRGTAVVGKGGTGWILITPTLANDQPSLFYTSTDYPDTESSLTPYVSANTLTTGVLQAVATNLPFTTAQLAVEDSIFATVGAVGRMVSASLTVQYTGTELQRSGLVTCYAHPTHENLAGLRFTSLDSKLEAEISPAGRSKCRVTTCAVTDEETNYQDFFPADNTNADYLRMLFPYSRQNAIQSVGGSLCGAAPMAVKFTGVPGQTFYFEYITHVEFVGTLADAAATQNDTDPIGLSLVQAAVSNLALAKISEPNKSLGALMKKELLEVAKRYGPSALKVGGQMILSSLT